MYSFVFSLLFFHPYAALYEDSDEDDCKFDAAVYFMVSDGFNVVFFLIFSNSGLDGVAWQCRYPFVIAS